MVETLAPMVANVGALIVLAVAVLAVVVYLRRDVAGSLAERVTQLERGQRLWVARVHQLETAMIASGLPVPPWPTTEPQESAAA